jgi:putative SOS response-associated peptidase YedK
MCGRYRLSRRKQLVEEYFDSVGDEDWTPSYNVAPTQPVPIIRQNPNEPHRELSLVRWGLIPWWAKNSSGAAMMITARSETAATKPAFRDALTLRRCLVPADGFYELPLSKAFYDTLQLRQNLQSCIMQTALQVAQSLRVRGVFQSDPCIMKYPVFSGTDAVEPFY